LSKVQLNMIIKYRHYSSNWFINWNYKAIFNFYDDKNNELLVLKIIKLRLLSNDTILMIKRIFFFFICLKRNKGKIHYSYESSLS
jgi:hypothetical protein